MTETARVTKKPFQSWEAEALDGKESLLKVLLHGLSERPSSWELFSASLTVERIPPHPDSYRFPRPFSSLGLPPGGMVT